MKKLRFVLIFLLIALALLASTAQASSSRARQFEAKLSGMNEVPAVETAAKGEAEFKLNGNGTKLKFKLEVEDITNPVAAHIHLGALGVNGPVVAHLYAGTAGSGAFDGTLSKGTITSASLVGPLAGQPLSALIEAMRSGNAYVNVHTNDGVAPTNTGAGDMASGEIRGQIEND